MAVSENAIQIAPEVNQFIAEPRKMLIDGRWVEAASGKTFTQRTLTSGEYPTMLQENEVER